MRIYISVLSVGLLALVPSKTFSQPETEFALDSVGVQVIGDYGSACYTGTRYIVVQESVPNQVDSDFFIRPAETGRCDADSLSGDIVLRNEWAAYFSGMRGDVLLLDSGTGPDIRDLVLVDMKDGHHIAVVPYKETAGGPDSVSLGVWEPSELERPMPGCEAPKGGLLPGVDSLFFVDIRNGNQRFGGQIRCASRQ